MDGRFPMTDNVTWNPGNRGSFVTNPVVLVVEDNPLHQRILTLLLANCGVSCHVVASGVEALNVLSTNRSYAAVLMDWKMPELDGLESTRRIRALERSQGARIPIIALTAHALVGAREECLQAGMDDYLSKPFTGERLRQTVMRWVDGTGSLRFNEAALAENSADPVRSMGPGTVPAGH